MAVKRIKLADNIPPPLIDCAIVLYYAIHDESVKYTGNGKTYMDGNLIGEEIRHSVISKNLCDPFDYMFMYCTENWDVAAVAGYETLEQAFMSAEIKYQGIKNRLISTGDSEENLNEYLENYWEDRRCNKCKKWPHEVSTLTKYADEWLCNNCAESQ